MRGALGPSPPCTSEDKRPSKGKWDDGGLAGTLGSPAGQPSTPGRTAGWFEQRRQIGGAGLQQSIFCLCTASVRRTIVAHA